MRACLHQGMEEGGPARQAGAAAAADSKWRSGSPTGRCHSAPRFKEVAQAGAPLAGAGRHSSTPRTGAAGSPTPSSSHPAQQTQQQGRQPTLQQGHPAHSAGPPSAALLDAVPNGGGTAHAAGRLAGPEGARGSGGRAGSVGAATNEVIYLISDDEEGRPAAVWAKLQADS